MALIYRLPEEEVLDDSPVMDYDRLDEIERKLDEIDRGFEAHQQRSRAIGSRGLGDPLSTVGMDEIGGQVVMIDESDFDSMPADFSVDLFDINEFNASVGDFIVEDTFDLRLQFEPLDLSKVVQEALGDDEFYAVNKEKKQIYLHHTVSPGDPMNAIRWWRQDRTKSGKHLHVATAFVIAGVERSSKKYKSGDIYQCFPSEQWAHHLGVSSRANLNKIAAKYRHRDHNIMLNKRSVGIELSSWGPVLPMKNGNFAPHDHYINVIKKHGSEEHIRVQIPAERVIEYPDKYRGFRYFERYPEAQLEATRKLLAFLCDKYQIPRTFDKNIFGLNERALRGDAGIFTHTSVRADKSDCHPQPELIRMLQRL